MSRGTDWLMAGKTVEQVDLFVSVHHKLTLAVCKPVQIGPVFNKKITKTLIVTVATISKQYPHLFHNKYL